MDYIESLVRWTMDLRKRSQGSFCILMSSVFITTGIIGHFVSGVMIVYTLLVLVLLTPGFIVHVLPSAWISLPSSSLKEKTIDSPPLSKCLFDLIQASSSSFDKSPSSTSLEHEVSDTFDSSEVAKTPEKPSSPTSFMSSVSENVIQMISSHFASSSSSSSSTPASMPSSPLRESTPGSDEENDPFVMVTESDIEKEFLKKDS